VAPAAAVGGIVAGTVERVEPFGVFVRLGPGQVGLVPNAEMATAGGTDHAKAFPPGTEIKVAVLAIEDGGRRIRLSRAQALRMEEAAETRAYLTDAARKGTGFGMTLGEALRRSQRP
jgi:small subunit ribosomal protein S1